MGLFNNCCCRRSCCEKRFDRCEHDFNRCDDRHERDTDCCDDRREHDFDCCHRHFDCCHNNYCCPPPFPPFPPFPPIPPINFVDALQVQLQGSSGGTIANGANVIFDTTILDATDDITYNSVTGVFTINRPGLYKIDWWVDTGGAGELTNVLFSLQSGLTSISASSPAALTTLQLYGQGLIEVSTVPTTFSLVNTTGTTVTYGTSTIQADLIIHKL